MLVCAVLLCLAIGLWLAAAGRRSADTLTYSQFLQEVRAGRIVRVIVQGSNSGAVHVAGSMQDGKMVRTVLPSDYEDALEAMQEKQVDVEIRDSFSEPLQLLRNATPFLLLLGIWMFLIIRKFPKNPVRSPL
jgi:ATP-dependent Zn protease